MSTHSFIVNINGALDMTHYGMYFYKGMSHGEITIFEIDTLCDQEIQSIPEKLLKYLNRNSFTAGNYRIVFCVARNCSGDETPLCDLYFKSWLARFFNDAMLTRTELLFFNRYDGLGSQEENNLRDRFCRVNKELEDNGYVPQAEDAALYGLFPSAADFSRTDIAESDVSQYAVDSGILQQFTQCCQKSGGDGTEAKRLYELVYKESKTKLQKINTVQVDIDTNDTESAIVGQMKICRFILRGEDDAQRDKPLQVRFEDFCKNQFKEGDEAAALLAYRNDLKDQKLILDRESEAPSLPLELKYQEMDLFPDVGSYEEIGGESDAREMVSQLSGNMNSGDWEEKYFEVVKKLEDCEKRLEKFGEKISDEFHSAEMKKEVIKEYRTVYEAQENVRETYKAASKQFYDLKEQERDEYSSILDTSNKFQKLRISILRIRLCKNSDRWKYFIPVLIAAMMAVIIPYLMTQNYIFSAVMHGKMIPIICALVYLLSFLLAKLIVFFSLSFILRREMRKLYRLIEKYLEGVKLRQKQFISTVNAMIMIHNAKAEREALSKELNRQEAERERLLYYKEKRNDLEHMLQYFDDFIEHVGKTGKAPTREAPDINKYVSAVKNEVFWI